MGDLANQIRLLIVLDAYEVSQRAADICPVPDQVRKADQLYMELLKIALACGFAPGREHSHLSAYEWATGRAEVIRRVFPNHVNEAKRRAA